MEPTVKTTDLQFIPVTEALLPFVRVLLEQYLEGEYAQSALGKRLSGSTITLNADGTLTVTGFKDRSTITDGPVGGEGFLDSILADTRTAEQTFGRNITLTVAVIGPTQFWFQYPDGSWTNIPAYAFEAHKAGQ